MRVLAERWVMALALLDARDPGPGVLDATPLFYALANPATHGRHDAPILIFASDPTSHHGEVAGAGPCAAAAAVYLESERVGELRGAQLRGLVIRDDRCSPGAAASLRERYLARHPIAAETLEGGRHRLYAMLVTRGKTTDNRLGFGVHPIAEFTDDWSAGQGSAGQGKREVEQSPG